MAVETRSPGWFVPSAGLDQMTLLLSPMMIRRPACPGSSQRAGGARHQMTAGEPLLLLLLVGGALLLRATPAHQPSVACWPPVQWGRAPFGEDDPSRGWEGRGNLQQRQCRPDSKSCQHLPGETIQLISGGQYLEVASRVFGGEMTKIEGRRCAPNNIDG